MAHKDEIKVLLIEDDPMVQEVNKEFIASVSGFQVVAVAGDGEEGIELVKKLKPELVILDIFMPKKDGIKTLQEFRKQNLESDVIVVSAAKDRETIKLMLQNGALDYIIKPFKLQRIQQALEKYRQYRISMRDSGTMSQEQLDLLLYADQPKATDPQLPKGLNEFTLNEVISYLQKQSEPRSAEEVASGIGIARVTARRYLDYLDKRGVIKLDVQYGGVGRPINRYLITE
ncbi:two-component system response regulator [Bacillus canaveralius]|uniref:Two-component system response regulator n=1 Tax=Bacillus canaveralius TaxID=1403243 RepID=A0A2N5GQP5_9BACI|nr:MULTISPECIES: response regulator [Bacillus]PLR85160.1 two-component system response regulator [Bacillus sp. V33-4]PLR85406.1 two-component system response regulator [Bacillus canaveralius]PLR94959.1 two-component system response regulator [Bacillus canaveralius]RSK45282.1 response regulator [Bacillus canaveralius]